MTHIDRNSVKHFGICFVLSLCGLYGACIAIGAALTKEYCDYKYYKHWCWWDLLFDILGCAVGFIIHWLLFKSVNF